MINRVILEGRLTKDIEIRKTSSNLSTAQFTLAVPKKFKKDEADWINCVVWRNHADFLDQYAHKGDLLSIEGYISTRSYEGQNGKVYVTEVICQDVNILTRSEPKNAPQGNSKENVVIEPDELPFY